MAEYGVDFSQKAVLKKSRNSELGVLYYQAFFNKTRIRFSMKHKILVKNWDENQGKIRGKGKEIADINLEIENVKAKATEILVQHRLRNQNITAEKFETLLRDEKRSDCFLTYMEEEISSRKEELERGTYNHHTKTFRRFKAYCKGHLPFYDVKTKLIRGFEAHLIKKWNNDVNTRADYLKTLKTYIRRAIADEKGIEKNPFDEIKIKRVGGNRQFLTKSEFAKYVKLFREQRLEFNTQEVLRMFLFSCVTGMRLSDVKALKRSQISINELRYTPIKTHNCKREEITLPLNQEVWEFLRLDGQIWFVNYPSQTINRQLAIINGIVGIRKHITFHCARHTFATNYIISGGTVTSLQTLLGHSKITDTMVYVHMAGINNTTEVNKYVDFMFSDLLQPKQQPLRVLGQHP